MAEFRGSVIFAEEQIRSYDVEIHLDEETLTLVAGEVSVGTWQLADVSFRGTDYGIRMVVDGEEVVVRTEDDGRFARAVGLRSAPPALAHKMAAAKKSNGEPRSARPGPDPARRKQLARWLVWSIGAPLGWGGAAVAGTWSGGGGLDPITGLIVIGSLGLVGVLGQLGLTGER